MLDVPSSELYFWSKKVEVSSSEGGVPSSEGGVPSSEGEVSSKKPKVSSFEGEKWDLKDVSVAL